MSPRFLKWWLNPFAFNCTMKKNSWFILFYFWILFNIFWGIIRSLRKIFQNTGFLWLLYSRIVNSIFIRENTGQRKLVFWHILSSKYCENNLNLALVIIRILYKKMGTNGRIWIFAIIFHFSAPIQPFILSTLCQLLLYLAK